MPVASVRNANPDDCELSAVITTKSTAEYFRIHCVSFRVLPTPERLHAWLDLYGFAPVSTTEAKFICSSIHVRFSKPEVKELTDEDLFGPNTNIESENDDMKTRNRSAHKAPAATLLKELNPKTIQGRLIEFLLAKATPMDDALDHFMLERHTVMTTLNVIARQTGIGYDVKDNVVTIHLPAGVIDPFEL